jgi:excisionase family DNA binding protein
VTEPVVAMLLDLLRPEIEQLVDELVTQRFAAHRLPQPGRWLTTAEAAGYLRLRPEALRARARRGSVPAHRDGDRYLFDRDELDRHLRSPDRSAATRIGGHSQSDPRAAGTAGGPAPKG